MGRHFFAIALVALLSLDALAKDKLPFVGTRKFCGEKQVAVVSVDKSGLTRVKTNMYTNSIRQYVTFSGQLSEKGIVKRKTDYSLLIKPGGRKIVMYAPQDSIDATLCK